MRKVDDLRQGLLQACIRSTSLVCSTMLLTCLAADLSILLQIDNHH